MTWFKHGCYAGNVDACLMYAEYFSDARLAQKAGTKLSERGIDVLREVCERKRSSYACSVLGEKLISDYARASEGMQYSRKACEFSDPKDTPFYCERWNELKAEQEKLKKQ